MSRREMDDEGLPWSSPKRKSDKYAKHGEEIMDILVDDIDRYEQLMFQDRLHWFGKRLTCSCYVVCKGNKKITELRAILQREGQNS